MESGTSGSSRQVVPGLRRRDQSFERMPRWLERVQGVILDLDGTVYDDGGLLPGAREAVKALRSAGLRLAFATNTSRHPRGALMARLRSLGVPVSLDEVITAPRAAAIWLAEQNVSRISLHIAGQTIEEFAAFELDERSPEAVVIGDLGDKWSVDRMNRVFRHVLAGARLVALQKNRYRTRGGALCLDAGPFVSAIEYATDVIAIVAGKPSGRYFQAAATLLDLPPEELVVVGDDLRADVEGAHAAGASSILVKTGKFSDADLTDTRVRPGLVLDSIADLPAVLQR